MNETFGLSKYGKTVFIVSGIFMILFGFGSLATAVLFSGLTLKLIFSPFAAGFLFLGVYLLLAVRRYTVRVDDSLIVERGVFFNKTINLDDYAGFRIAEANAQRSVVFIPKNKAVKRKVFGVNYLAGREKIMAYIAERLESFDQKDIEEDFKTISEDENLGITKDERFAKLRGAKRLVRAALIVVIVLAPGSVIFPKYRDYFIAALAAMPFLLLFLVFFSGGLIKFDTKNATLYPSVLTSFCFSWAGILFFSLAYIPRILTWKPALFSILVFALLLFALFLFVLSREKPSKGTLVSVLFFSLVYGFGAALCLNDLGSRRIAEQYPVIVTDKRISRGKSTSYYFTVSPWGDRKEADDITVGRTSYEKYEINDTVTINIIEGKFGIRFYLVR